MQRVVRWLLRCPRYCWIARVSHGGAMWGGEKAIILESLRLQARLPTESFPVALLNRRQTAEKQKVLDLLKKISPVAWQHIHFLGHYLFRNNHQPIDLEAILAHAGFD